MKEQEIDWQELVRQAHEQIKTNLEGCEVPPIEEILAQLRKERLEKLPSEDLVE